MTDCIAKLRTATAGSGLADPAPVRLTTPLVTRGRPPVIFAPDHAEGRTAAAALKDALARRLGLDPVVVTRLSECDPGRQTCIALGNMLDNELLTRLYFSRYTYEDAVFPGPEGYTIHTVYDPQHWADGNVIVLGASRREALPRACERFMGLLEGAGTETCLPYTLLIHPTRALTEAQRAEVTGKPVDPSLTAFRASAESYLKTGEEAHARMAIAALDTMVVVYAGTPDRKVPWPEETTAGEIFAAWDAFEECPFITPENRAAYLNAFLLWARDLTRCSYEYGRITESFTVTWNHTTFALLGLYYAGRYFDRRYRVPEAAEWLRRARLGFRAQARSWKPLEDADSYLVHTMQHVIDFSLADWDLAFFEKGLIRRYADYAVMCGDSRQLPAGFGDSGYSTQPRMATEALPVAYWWTRDPGYRWILERVHPDGWKNPFWPDVEPAEPARFAGLHIARMDRQIYDDTQSRPSYNEPLKPSEVPFEQAWDKISFRESWDPNAQYMLLDGLGRGKHLHFDTNSIVTFVQDGERWLVDHDYLTRNTTEHAMLSVLRDGRCESLVPSLAGLAASGNLGEVAATRTYVKDYNGVDWEREVLWNKGAWFVIRDTVKARTAGSYDLDLTWKTIDRGDQRVDAQGRFMARREAGALHIDAAEPVRTWVTDHARQGISVPVCILHQRRSVELKAGQATVLCSLLYATGPTRPAEHSVEVAGPGVYCVTSGDVRSVAGFGPSRAGSVDCDAEAWLLRDGMLTMLGGRGFRATEAAVSVEPAADLALDFGRGELTVLAKAPTRLSASGCAVSSRASDAGQGAVEVPAGTHVLKVTGFDSAGGSGIRTRPAVSQAKMGVGLPKAPAATPLWTVELGEGKSVFRITPAEIDDDGQPELLVACGNAGYALSGDGRLLWTCRTEGAVRDVSMARFDRGGPATVHVSSADTRVYQLDPSGVLKRRAEMRGIYFSADHGERPWGVYCTRAVDANADGVDDMLVTTLASMETQGLEPDLARRWRTPRTAYHGCMDIAVEDVNRDGKPEIVLGNKYGSICVLGPDGTQMATSRTSIGDVWFALGDLNGDGMAEVVHGSSTGDLVAVDLKGEVIWRFDNFGYPVSRILCTDLDGDGRPEVLIASGTGHLYCLAPDGSLRWAKRLGTAVHEVTVAGRTIVAGTEEGEVHVLDGAGRILQACSMGAAVVRLAPMQAAAGVCVVAGLSNGRVVAMAIR